MAPIRATFAFLAFAALFAAAPSVRAETAAEAEDVLTCPAGAVSVYFAEGVSLVSEETRSLIGKVGETARACDAGTVDLIAWVDPGEGGGALSLALDRLKIVAAELGAQGLPLERLRIAARTASGADASPGPRNVKIFIRGASELTPAGRNAPPPRAPALAGAPRGV